MRRFRPTVVEVDLDAVRRNVRRLLVEDAGLMAVVKADGYGHGDAEVARAALEAGAGWLGVALVEEGLGLRDRGIDAPILVLSEFPAGSEKEALAGDLTPSVYTREGLAALAEAARAGGRAVGVHLKLDTGMHRVGVWPPEEGQAFARDIAEAGLRLDGVWTHFPDAERDDDGTRARLARFRAVLERMRAAGVAPSLAHAANSAATIRVPESRLDLVRPGAAVYGLDPGDGIGPAAGLEPALTWRSAVSMVKRLLPGERVSYGGRFLVDRASTIATVPVGYDDGFPRSAEGRAEVLVRGRRCPVIGAVTMDQILVDCGDDEVVAGDEVVIAGAQGAERISLDDLASACGTIGRELATGIGARVPREYLG